MLLVRAHSQVRDPENGLVSRDPRRKARVFPLTSVDIVQACLLVGAGGPWSHVCWQKLVAVRQLLFPAALLALDNLSRPHTTGYESRSVTRPAKQNNTCLDDGC
jgi:hypothetical protein